MKLLTSLALLFAFGLTLSAQRDETLLEKGWKFHLGDAVQAQARAMALLLDMLDEQELAVYKRGRNTRVNSVPKHAELSQYHAATGLEALFGWLYLQGKLERINQLFRVIMENNHAT